MIPKKKDQTKLISNLNVSDTIKRFLYKTLAVASSDNDKIKASVEDIFIQSPACTELSRIAKTLESIITGYSVYPMHGLGTYIELALPKGGSERDYREFFESPKRVAATQNFFAGVFLLSFEQWSSADDLMRDEIFPVLIKFIRQNKNHITFVFHVLPDFRNVKQLYDELFKHTNLVFLEHFFPDKEAAITYVVNRMYEADIDLNTESVEEIEQLVSEKIDFSSPNYNGYETLKRFSDMLIFELCSNARLGSDNRNKKGRINISGDDIMNISAKIELPNSSDNRKTIGFT